MTRLERTSRWLDRARRWLRRLPHGNWRPARLDDRDMTFLALVFGVVGLNRGFDYLTGADSVSKSLSIVEQVASLWAWGAGFAFGATILLIGVWGRIHSFVWLGHGLLAAGYSLLGVGIIWSVLGNPWGDGVRTGGALLALAAVHWVVCSRTGVRPLTDGEARPTEVVEGPR